MKFINGPSRPTNVNLKVSPHNTVIPCPYCTWNYANIPCGINISVKQFLNNLNHVELYVCVWWGGGEEVCVQCTEPNMSSKTNEMMIR